MPFRDRLVSILLPALLLAAGPGRAAEPGTLLELGELEGGPVADYQKQYQARIAQDLGARYDAFKGLGPLEVFGNLIKDHIRNSVPSRKVTYASVDSHGTARTYTGRVYLPSRKPGDPPREVPLVLYQHATETWRDGVASRNQGDEAMLGALAAELCGFAVAMPDGDGMGGDPAPNRHEYCLAKTTAPCLLDMIRAVQGQAGGRRLFDDVNYIWDGEIYIVGYSEGGYISMAAVKELSTNPAYKDIKLKGAACMAGPFDFAQAVRKLLSDAKTPYGNPYIPGYFLMTWQGIHPDLVPFKDAVNPELLKTDSTGNIYNWLDGSLPGSKITPLIQARLTGDRNQPVPARRILNDAWVKENIETPGSRLNRIFDENSLVGRWRPHVPVLLAHDPHDQTVNFSGTQAIFDDWSRQGVHPIGIIRLAVGGTGAGHVGGALVAIPSAFVWIDAGMPRSLMAMTRDRIMAAIAAAAPPELEANVDVLATTMGMQEGNENRALLPLSRIDYKAPAGARPYTLGYGDRLFKVGKVKVYTVEKAPQFASQKPSPGLDGYTRLVKEMKNLSDTCQLAPNVPYFIAVYPEKGGVALTLRFTGATANYTTNIKQVKNKIIGRNTAVRLDVSPNFKARVFPDNFDRAERGGTFITLP